MNLIGFANPVGEAPRTAIMLAATIAMIGCQPANVDPVASTRAEIEVACRDPRPEACTLQYQPVCGLRDIGTWKTYGNACAACRNADVIGHKAGECDTAELKDDASEQ